MKASKFYLLKDIRNNNDFYRKKDKKKGIGKHNVPGVYFWGFTLTKDATLPNNKNEFVIYYIGKDKKSIIRRMMEEVTQLLFGGYGTIIDHHWLQKNFHSAKINEKHQSDKSGMPRDKDILYKSDGLNVLYDFFKNKQIQKTLDWMRERLIFSWVEVNEIEEIDPLELEMHNYVKNNILGLKGRVNFLNNNKFSCIDWSNNEILKEWLEEVQKKIKLI